VESEGAPTAGVGVQAVGKPGLDARAFVQKRQRPVPGREVFRQARAVFSGLDFNTDESRLFGFGFHHTCCFAMDVQQVIGLAMSGLEPELSNCNTPAGI
jgi:hypothetical protein